MPQVSAPFIFVFVCENSNFRCFYCITYWTFSIVLYIELFICFFDIFMVINRFSYFRKSILCLYYNFSSFSLKRKSQNPAQSKLLLYRKKPSFRIGFRSISVLLIVPFSRRSYLHYVGLPDRP